MSTVHSAWCGNCQYWDGPRKVGVFKDSAEVKTLGDKGRCTNPKCNHRGRDLIASFNMCTKYFEKWDQLK